ncbi:SDR family NAD(P)-dependent oxidoreductase [Streptomyces sp. NPDC058701]|uniref:SDR family NAD(P)-dependent oxidoreductase n=1 Tax=Streptomyces sp. NPDC058701 TaxID=3346608 RepID=UPI003655A4E2
MTLPNSSRINLKNSDRCSYGLEKSVSQNQPPSRVVLVTGAGSGIGEATARRFAEAGDRVIVGDIDFKAAIRVAAEAGTNAHAVELDVTNMGQWSRAIEHGEEFATAPIQILVNNAGVFRQIALDAIELDEWQYILNVNLTGTMIGMRAILPSMRRAGGGVIVNTGSTAGLGGAMGLSAYSSAKWALRGLTKCAALEFAADNIRVNLIVPGVTDTPAARAAGFPSMMPGQAIPEIAQPAVVAHATFYLASNEASYSTGSELVVDGGQTAGQV